MPSDGGLARDQDGDCCQTLWMISARSRPPIKGYCWDWILGLHLQS